MSRIVIHVGTHKTATTHIQDTFYANRDLLKRNGVIVPVVGQTRGQHGLACAWINLPPPYAISDPEMAWREISQKYAKTDYTVFVSSEELSRLRPRQVDMAQLCAFAKDFDQTTVLCTLRNQASFLQSVYQQVSDDGQPGNWPRYFEAALTTRFAEGLALDYTRLWQHLRKGFATSQIRLLSYEEASASEGGIVGAMLRVLQAPLKASDLVPFAEKNSNVSPPPLATLAANMVAGSQKAPQWLVAFATKAFQQAHGSGPKGTVFSREDLARMKEVFEPLNRQLEGFAQKMQPEFQMAPMLPGADHLFREDLSEDFWVALARQAVLHRQL